LNTQNSFNLQTRAYLALGAICIIWGTTYAAIKLAVFSFPPFLMVGIRQTGAGAIMLTLALLTGKAHPVSRRYLLRQILAGVAMITGGNGFVTWGLQYVSSGLSSVIGALTPVLVTIIALAWRDQRDKISSMTLLGVLVGFAGMGLVFSDGWRDFLDPAYRWGIIGCFSSCLTWSLGTVMAKRYNDPAVSPLFNAGMQITAGGLGGFVLSALFDTTHEIRHSAVAWSAILYLMVVGSALAFSLYMFALRHLNTTVASLYTYINPVVAVLIGWLYLNEHFTIMELTGICITLAGVWIVNRGSR
jgi:drug/metabolite transporter (DMT)-like permease